jgi:hypothetical protein
MACIVSLPSANPLEPPLTQPRCMRSSSSLASHLSSGTVRRCNRPAQSQAWPLPELPPRLPSDYALTYIHDFGHDRSKSQTLSTVSTVSQVATPQDEPSARIKSATKRVRSGSANEGVIKTTADISVAFPSSESPIRDFPRVTPDLVSTNLSQPRSSPFRRWLNTLRKRHSQESYIRGTIHCLDGASPSRRGHQKSASFSSSIGFLTAVKSASLTLAGASMAPTSKHGKQNHLHSDSNSLSFLGHRQSIDSTAASIEPAIDCKAWIRSIQRRNIVDEMLNSEESYISDMKAMTHVKIFSA